MSDTPGFPQLMPGFEFFQGLVKNAGSALPGIGQWVAPTLDPDEIGRRIEELRTVKFWLEQNARILETTLQALEVQRMTLSTLKTMNVQMEDLRESLKVPLTDAQSPRASSVPTHPAATAAPAPAGATRLPRSKRSTAAASAATAAAPAAPAAATPAVDPMQWWTALTQQFTEIAAQALKDSTAAMPQPVAPPPAPPGAAATTATPRKPRAAARPRPAR
jgi:hypothetical protein